MAGECFQMMKEKGCMVYNHSNVNWHELSWASRDRKQWINGSKMLHWSASRKRGELKIVHGLLKRLLPTPFTNQRESCNPERVFTSMWRGGCERQEARAHETIAFAAAKFFFFCSKSNDCAFTVIHLIIIHVILHILQLSYLLSISLRQMAQVQRPCPAGIQSQLYQSRASTTTSQVIDNSHAGLRVGKCRRRNSDNTAVRTFSLLPKISACLALKPCYFHFRKGKINCLHILSCSFN